MLHDGSPVLLHKTAHYQHLWWMCSSGLQLVFLETLNPLSPDQPFYNFGVWKMNLAFNYFGSEQSLNYPIVDSSFRWLADPEKKLIKRPADEWVLLRISSCYKLVLCLQPSALWLSLSRQQRKNIWKEGFWIDSKNLTAESVHHCFSNFQSSSMSQKSSTDDDRKHLVILQPQ